MSEPTHLMGVMTDGHYFKSVAPLVRDASGKYENVIAVIYNGEGLPVEFLLATASRLVPVAEWEPMQDL